ncbi:hypothetical protein [Pendulispora rubella]|uniref:hypothetical protein n=1 Tax=Pendulispora rubella TaxID=2741070 RepID=UPI0038B35D87
MMNGGHFEAGAPARSERSLALGSAVMSGAHVEARLADDAVDSLSEIRSAVKSGGHIEALAHIAGEAMAAHAPIRRDELRPR